MIARHHGHSARVSGTLENLVALVPLPCVHLVRYGGCLTPRRWLWGAIIPTLR